MAKQKKELDAEVNLIAFISLLSVLICSLLLTAIWVQIGSMEVKQAVGGQAAENTQPPPTLWAFLHKDGRVRMELQHAPRKARKYRKTRVEPLKEGGIDVESFRAQVATIKLAVPNLTMALIQPKAETLYEDIITLMDNFKQEGLTDLGVSPL